MLIGMPNIVFQDFRFSCLITFVLISDTIQESGCHGHREADWEDQIKKGVQDLLVGILVICKTENVIC